MTFTRSQYALAASIAALVVAAPLAFQMTRSGLQDAGSLIGSELLRTDKDRSETKIARLEKKIAPAADAPSREGARTGMGGTLGLNEAKPPVPAPPAPPASSEIDGLGNMSRPAQAPMVPGGGTALAQRKAKADDETRRQAVTSGFAGTPSASAPATQPLEALNGPAGGHFLAKPSAAPIADGRLRAERAAPGDKGIVASADADRQPAVIDQEYRDNFEAKEINPVKRVAEEPVSTFSIDVDTASYSFVRRALNAGHLPPKDAVRVEEMINYFPYAYPKPAAAETPFEPTVTVMQAPWNPSNQLVHVAIKGYELASSERPRANLVFLIDVSGSMGPADKLPLVKNAFRMLVDELRPDDTVGIVTYASGSGVLLEPTKITDKGKILAAIERLGAGGSTAGAEGIQDAYRLAETNFDKSAVNRVILATDGDFNVGVTSQDDLKGLIERKRENGIFLSILGVGQGNYNDALMQTLAQNGNGTAAYVDTLNEARKVLVDEASSTLFTIAKDVKVQVEWNPARVSEYRLIGYETRALRREDFNNDRVDAGDIGSGHTVTAIYEVTPVGAPAMVDDLRYGRSENTAAANNAPAPASAARRDDEIGFLKLRYKLPKEDTSKLVTLPIREATGEKSVEAAPAEARFSVAVAAFGQLLKGAPYLKSYTYDDVLALAQTSRGADPFGYRAEFLNLVRLAKSARP